MRIAGSLWSVPVDARAHRLATAVAAGLPVVHWDASDGRFAAPGGFTPSAAGRLLASAPPVESEAHLMSHAPAPEVPAWAELCTMIVVPLEVDGAPAAVAAIEARGVRPALAVSLGTPLEQVPSGLPVLLMAITPGEAGAPFDPAVLDRVRRLRDRGRNPVVGVDGGVGPGHFSALAEAGAQWLVSGTSLFQAPDPGAWLEACRRSVPEG